MGQTHGNRIRSKRPTVTLLTGSKEAGIEGGTNQPIVTLFTYNKYGQILTRTRPRRQRYPILLLSRKQPKWRRPEPDT